MSVSVSTMGMTELIFFDPRVKVNSQYYCDVLLSHRCFQQSTVSQNVVYSQTICCLRRNLCHFLYSGISQGKVVALDRTLIVKVIAENVVTCFFMGHSVVITYDLAYHLRMQNSNRISIAASNTIAYRADIFLVFLLLTRLIYICVV